MYKIVIDDGYKKYVKDKSRSKDHLETKALSISKKHPRWKIYVVDDKVLIQYLFDGPDQVSTAWDRIRVNTWGHVKYKKI